MSLETLEQIREFTRLLNAARPVDIQTDEQLEQLAEQANIVENAAPVGLSGHISKLRGSRIIAIDDEYQYGPIAFVVEVHDPIGSSWQLFTMDGDG